MIKNRKAHHAHQSETGMTMYGPLQLDLDFARDLGWKEELITMADDALWLLQAALNARHKEGFGETWVKPMRYKKDAEDAPTRKSPHKVPRKSQPRSMGWGV